MKENILLSRNSYISPVFIFVVSFLVCLCYFFRLYPGYYSRDALDYIRGFLEIGSLSDASHSFFSVDLSVSSFYVAYIFIFYSITKNLAALGLFQIILICAINTYCWTVLVRFCKYAVALAVVLLMIFSPLNGIVTMWYHRSSLFGYLVCLNLLLLYKFSKTFMLGRLERIIFLLNLLFVSFLRIDGSIVSFASLFIYILISKERKLLKMGISAGFILVVVIYSLLPWCVHRNAYLELPFPHQVRRIYQSTGVSFTDKDMRVLTPVVPNESDRERWLEGTSYIDGGIFNRDISRDDSSNFIRWNCLFISKNLFHFIATQTEVFYASSLLGNPLAHYFHENDMHKEVQQYREMMERLGASNGPCLARSGKMVRFILGYGYPPGFLASLRSIFVALAFGVSMPFVFTLVYFAIALKRNRNLLIPLFPLFLYSIFVFLFQPRPKAYYWYWLAYSHYFIVFGLGYEIIATIKKGR